MKRQMELHIRVSCLARASEAAQEFQPSHVVSLLDPDMRDKLPAFDARVERTALFFFDQERPDAAKPVADATRRLVEWVIRLLDVPRREDPRVLFHCHAGASRSPAAAYIALAAWYRDTEENELFDRLLRITRKPWPNARMVTTADGLLGRGGRLIEPLNHYREQHTRRLDAYRRLNRRRGIVSKVSR
jgi:predicted protein tyrosine phosphatase